jgi:hypothetical protein
VFLKTIAQALRVGSLILTISSAQAEDLAFVEAARHDSPALFHDVSARATTQIGLDYWHLNPSVESGSNNRRFFLANNTSQWNYKNLSPWMTVNGKLEVASKVAISLKFRADQSSGLRIDELNADYAVSPSLGIRAGVLDYKVSWCRRYEIDLPWVRENDPFCTVRTTGRAIGAAPGLQVYGQTFFDDYRIQAVAGVFRPKAFSYDKDEFTNYEMDEFSTVQVNNKRGASVSAVNVNTGTEFRLSWQGSDQRARIAYPDTNAKKLQQKVDLLYGGFSYYLKDGLSIRATYLKSNAKSGDYLYEEDPWQQYPINPFNSKQVRVSKTLEFIYQMDAANIFAFAASRYDFKINDKAYRYNHFPLIDLDFESDWRFRNDSFSLGWRRDWRKGLFTSLQLTTVKTKQVVSQNKRQNFKGHAHALGLRLGYRF